MRPEVLKWEGFTLRGAWQCLETVSQLGTQDATGIWQVEAKDAAKHATIHRTKVIQPQMSAVLRLRDPGLDHVRRTE